MSCKRDTSCVCGVIRRIVKAQNKVAVTHKSSCDSSIKQLFSGHTKPTHTTIPFILYNEDGKPFIASSVHKMPIKGYEEETYYECIESPVLRAKSVDEKCCATFELLRPVNANGFPIADRGEELCEFFSSKTPYKTIDFRETGVCLTMDLRNFSGITCLEPTTPLPKLKRKKHKHY